MRDVALSISLFLINSSLGSLLLSFLISHKDSLGHFHFPNFHMIDSFSESVPEVLLILLLNLTNTFFQYLRNFCFFVLLFNIFFKECPVVMQNDKQNGDHH